MRVRQLSNHWVWRVLCLSCSRRDKKKKGGEGEKVRSKKRKRKTKHNRHVALVSKDKKPLIRSVPKLRQKDTEEQ